MAKTKNRDGREGRRRRLAGIVTAALCLLLLVMMPACGTDNPTSPNSPSDLTGQTTNQVFTFSGSIGLATVSGTLVADGTSTVTITATVRDASGNPVPNLTNVTFSTDLGGFLVQNAQGDFDAFSVLQVPTFSGLASASLASPDGIAGTANVSVSLGQVISSTSVDVDPAPLAGTLALSFGPDGNGPTVMTGTGTKAQPLDLIVGATALDAEGEPIAGALVEYHFVVDTTGTGDFVTGNDVLTGPSGNATNLLRVSAPGDIAIEASIDDPNTGDLVAVSNRIFLTSGVALLPSLEFTAGGASFSGVAPYTAPLLLTVTDTDGNPQDGLTVRFTIVDDTTDAGGAVTTGIGITNAAGQVSSGIVVPDASTLTSTVTVVAEIVDTSGEVVATSNVVVATGTF